VECCLCDVTWYSVVKHLIALLTAFRVEITLHSVTYENVVFFIVQFATKLKALCMVFVHEKLQ